MKRKLGLFVSFILIFFCTIKLFSQGVQDTTVVKYVSDNPSLAISSFQGPDNAFKQLQTVLIRCDWFRYMQRERAAEAQIKIKASYSEQAKTYQAEVSAAGQSSFLCTGTHNDLNQASFLLVDAILKKLFNVPAYCSRPIAFVMPGQHGMKEIFTCFIDGSGQQRVTNNSAISTEPGWGHKNALAYTLIKNNALSVVLVDVQNKRQRIISRGRGLNSSAKLSPDGRQIALALSREHRVDLYVKNLATNKEVRLSNDKYVESSPCWAPDGKTICFVSDKLGRPQLFLVSADGGPAKRLQLGGNECVSPDWSLVSNKLCYSTRTNTGKYVIAVLDMKQKNPIPEIITLAAGDWEAPSWAPDGRHIVCIRSSGKSRDLYLLDSWLKSFQPISKGANLALPAWAPAY